MGLAAYNIEADCKEKFRYMIHDEVDKWVVVEINCLRFLRTFFH